MTTVIIVHGSVLFDFCYEVSLIWFGLVWHGLDYSDQSRRIFAACPSLSRGDNKAGILLHWVRMRIRLPSQGQGCG